MARSWADSPVKRARIRRIDDVLHAVIRPRSPEQFSPVSAPKRILVIELWQVGDVVLSSAALVALRANFPDARITLLAKAHAEELLRHADLVDEFIAFDFPWTAFRGKYRPWRYDLVRLAQLFRRLRGEKFDVSIDARMDVRSNVVAFLSGAKRRIGYDAGGGASLLTDALPAHPEDSHKVTDWLELLQPLGIRPAPYMPLLVVSPDEKHAAETRLRKLGLLERPLVMIHPGAGQKVRRLEPEKFSAIAEHAVSHLGADVVVLLDDTGVGERVKPRVPVHYIAATLREMMALLSCAALLVANDSGPMHIAAALGIPVVAIFGPQRPEWYGPYGQKNRVVYQRVMPCRPCFDSCIFAEPICIIGIQPETVIAAMDELSTSAQHAPNG
jgi:heptosyltransferase-2